MRKLIALAAAIAVMVTMSLSAYAADGTAVTTPGDSTGISTALGGSTGAAWQHTDDDDAVAAAFPDTTTDINVWATTTRTDAYKVTIAWGDMTFNYDLGTWNPNTHAWGAETEWDATEFDGTKDQVKVTNHSSQSIDATFSYAKDLTNGGSTTGTFTAASGNANGVATGTMTIAACPEGATDLTAPSDKTYLNLQGTPDSIGATAKKLGTITVTISA